MTPRHALSPLQRLAALRNDLSDAITIGLRKNRTDLVSLAQKYSLACNSLAALYKPDNGDDRWLASEIGIIELGARDAIRSLNEASSLEEVRANYRTFLAKRLARGPDRRAA